MRILALFLILLPLLSAADSKPATVDGLALNSVTGAPIKKALVTLRSEEYQAGYQVLTDSVGRFHFENVAAGKYALCGEAQGFAGTVPDAARSAAPAFLVTLTEGQAAKDLAIRLEPYGVISGKVTDENGDPVRGAYVSAQRYAYSRAGRKLHGGATVPQKSDDRGEYRIINIPSGRWYIDVSKDVEAPRAAGHVHGAIALPVYGRAQAGPIEVEPGADVANVDVKLAPVPTFHVRGKVIDARTGLPPEQAKVHVDSLWYATLRNDGVFDFGSMTAGPHVLMTEVEGTEKLWAPAEHVTITDRDVEGLVIRVAPGITVQGTALVDGMPSAPPDARVTLETVEGLFDGTSARIAGDGSFTVPFLAPQQYRVLASAKGLYLKSARFGDRELSGEIKADVVPGSGPLTLSFGRDGAQVLGVIKTPPTGVTPVRVTVVPEGALAGRPDLLKTEDPDDDTGAFHVDALAPGDYRVFAWELKDLDWAGYPDFSQLLESKSIAITLGSGEHKTVELKVITAAEIAEARRRLP